jgi:hypothetical protein
MNTRYVLVAAALAACSRPLEIFRVAPDNKHVLIGSASSLRSIDVDTGAEVARAVDVIPGYAIFSDDGSRFIVRSTRDTLVVMPTTGGAQVDLGPIDDLGMISKDGTRVAFLRNSDPCEPMIGLCAEPDLFSAASSGGDALRVASRTSGSYGFAGNDTLVFGSADGALMSARADGTAPPVLLAPPLVTRPREASETPPFWVLSDGRVVVDDGTGLMLMDAMGGARVRLADSGWSLLCGRFSCPISDGRLAVVSPPSPNFTVRIVSLDGIALVTLTASDPLMVFDSEGRFVFVDGEGFLSEALRSGEVHELGRYTFGFLSPILSPDAKWASYPTQIFEPLCTTCGGVQLLSTVTAATSTVPITSVSCCNWEFSPDSRALLLRTDARQLAVVSLEGGQVRLVETDVDEAQWAGPNHIVINRTRSVPEGVSILRLP